jgi:hypothetical protein
LAILEKRGRFQIRLPDRSKATDGFAWHALCALRTGVIEVLRPFARALFLCDYVVGYANGKTDLYGLFNAIRPRSYPHTQGRFCLFAQLVGGLGNVRFFADIIFRPRNELVRTTEAQQLHFADRDRVVQMALEIRGCLFPEPGPYLVELYCDDLCVADVPVQLLEGGPPDEQPSAAAEP